MGLFQEIMTNESKIFRNQDLFNIDYFPEVLPCRINELKAILLNLKPLLNNNKSLNTIIMGNRGTGKTTVIKHALFEIEHNTNLKTCYINCNVQNTARKCYFQIYKVLYETTPHNNISNEIIELEIMKKLEEETFILVFDDINYLSKNDANMLINEFFRANEFYPLNMGLILIINDEHFKYSLEKNTQTILVGSEIFFNDYGTEDIYLILKDRCDLGFNKNVITDNQIRKLSEYIAYNADLRQGLTFLNILGQKLEIEKRDKVEDEDLNDFIYDI